MLRKNDNLQNGLNLICNEDDNVYMRVELLKLTNGETYSFCLEDREAAWLLLSGTVVYKWDDSEVVATRNDLFHDDAYCLHTPKNTNVVLTAQTDAEVLIQSKENDTVFESKMYDKSNIDKQFFGDGNLSATTKRQVTTILDYERTPWSKMVIGEITNFPGIWSSYPPHWHPQPEVYFYKFDKPQGFGTCFMGDTAYKSTHNSVAMIPGGLTHPQNAAPGYAMYYTWMIPHLENDPWVKTRIFDEDHTWVNDENAKFFEL